MPIKKGEKKVMNAWAFYDWANSVYPLVVTSSIFPVFFENTTDNVETFFGYEIINTVLYSYVIAASFLVVSVLSPILSGIADYSGGKKRFLQFFCYLGALSCASLYFFNPNQLEIGMLSIFLASIGFWNSLVFYNAYLPEIAEPKDHDWLSAKGFSLGYFGSSILLIICLILIKVAEIPVEFCFLLVGVWWIGFSQITYRNLPSPKEKKKISKEVLSNGFKELKKVMRFITTTKRLKRYLLSFFIFSMGVQTIMLMAVLFAKKEVFPDGDASGLIYAVLIIQFIAIPGAFAFSKASAKWGNLVTLNIALVIWIIACSFAYFFVYDKINFYILSGLVGFVMGGTQSLSRSTYSKFLPETNDTASFFSFYDITEKIGIVIGMVIFGYVESTSGDMRASILALIAFFIVGFVALLFVPKEEMIKEA